MEIFCKIQLLSIIHFPNNIISGILLALFVQFCSVIFVFTLMAYYKLYVPATLLCACLSLILLIGLFIANVNMVLIGFILPYVAVIFGFRFIAFLIGFDAMSFLFMNSLMLIMLYGVLLILNYYNLEISTLALF